MQLKQKSEYLLSFILVLFLIVNGCEGPKEVTESLDKYQKLCNELVDLTMSTSSSNVLAEIQESTRKLKAINEEIEEWKKNWEEKFEPIATDGQKDRQQQIYANMLHQLNEALK